MKRKDLLKNFANFTEKHLFRSLLFSEATDWKPETFRSSLWRCSVKQGVLKNFANFIGNNLCWSFFDKVTFLGPVTLSKMTPTQVLSCENWNYFEEHLWISTWKLYWKLLRNTYSVDDLQATGSETPVQGSLFNNVASLTAWRSLTVLERDCSTGISLWILWNF